MTKTAIQSRVIFAKEKDPFEDSLNHFLSTIEENVITGIQYQEVQGSFSALVTYRAKIK
jgi:hypothetical protein